MLLSNQGLLTSFKLGFLGFADSWEASYRAWCVALVCESHSAPTHDSVGLLWHAIHSTKSYTQLGIRNSLNEINFKHKSQNRSKMATEICSLETESFMNPSQMNKYFFLSSSFNSIVLHRKPKFQLCVLSWKDRIWKQIIENKNS